MKQPFVHYTESGEPRYRCIKHGFLPCSSFYPSDIRRRRACCRVCVRHRVAKSRGQGPRRDEVKRVLAAFKQAARRHGRPEAKAWEPSDVRTVMAKCGVESEATLRGLCIRPAERDAAWLPHNCRLVAVAEAKKRRSKRGSSLPKCRARVASPSPRKRV